MTRAVWHFGHDLFRRLNALMYRADEAGITAREQPDPTTVRAYYSVLTQLWVNVSPVAKKKEREAIEAVISRAHARILNGEYGEAAAELTTLQMMLLHVLQAWGLLYQIGKYASAEKALEQWGVEVFRGEKREREVEE